MRDPVPVDDCTPISPSELREAIPRYELLDLIDVARDEFASAITQLRASHATLTQGDILEQSQAKLQALNALRDQLADGAKGRPLASLRAEVRAAIAAVHAYASEVRGAAQSEQTTQPLGLVTATAHRDVQNAARDVFDRKIFDPYLRFVSPQDEEEYRKREAERKHYIEEQQAKGTPQGELNATNTMIAQLDDAKAHGAAKSPEFAPMRERLSNDRAKLATAQKAEQSSHRSEASKSDDPIANSDARPHQTASRDAAAILLAAGTSVGDADGQGHGVSATAVPQGTPSRRL
jgi:hypothetical protein